MNAVTSIPALRLLNRHSPAEIADAIEVLMDLLDVLGGDPDVELNGDEADDDGDRRDQSFTEWHTRGRHKLANGHEPASPTAGFSGSSEDDEDADADEDDDPAEHDDSDRCEAGDDHMIAGPVTWRAGWERWDQFTGAKPGDDDDHEPSRSPDYHVDQTRDLILIGAND